MNRTPVMDRVPVRVAIVDDHPLFRMGMRVAMADMADIELVGVAESVAQVPDMIATARPDVVLLDIGLPDGSGLEVSRWLAEHHPEIKVIILTMSEDEGLVLSAVRDGACGYLVKGASPEQVEWAVHFVAAGGVALDHDLVRGVSELAANRRSNSNRPFPQLTTREREVLCLISKGMNNRDIARRLVLSDKTVRNHVSNVLTKLPAADRAQAIVMARRAGLCEHDE
jgi:DNA-binding NarL/FixJ family response regulator